MSNTTKILMVCLGNICRSPLADGLLRQKVKSLGLDVFVDSCGTSSYHIGEPPDERMINTAFKYDYDISNLRARQFTKRDFKEFDVIYVMDASNYNNVIALAETKEDREKVKLFLNELHPQSNMPVPDPYFGGEQGFEKVFNLVDETTDKIIEKLKK
ncbi:MAG TPA: low molecular weight phosphotyrosine protein phosphatase [Crocinitomix sp.]|nr:low molecular weight phosphotyrosine protein phosphatase [Crocinitomix sp.]